MKFISLTKVLMMVMIPAIIMLLGLAVFYAFRRNWLRTALASGTANALLVGPTIIAGVVNGILEAIINQVNAIADSKIQVLKFNGMTILSVVIIIGFGMMAATAQRNFQKNLFRICAAVLAGWLFIEKAPVGIAYVRSLF